LLQPVSFAQLVAQAAPAHWYAPHDVVAPGLHVPAPSQVEAACSCAVEQLAAPQTVPAIHLRQAPAPSQLPSVPQLEAAEAVHSLRGLVPGSANLHVPTLFVALQVEQVPLQAVSQQTPSTQWPLPQSLASSHTVPFVSTGTQAVATQWLPAAQSVFARHDVAHEAAPHAYAPHDWSIDNPQVPAPSQVRAVVNVETLHDAATQIVPTVYLRHAPLPSHVPSRPQVDIGSTVHSLSGSVPPMMPRQRPLAWAVFEPAHAMQPPVHALSQQKPSTQAPVEHWEGSVQAEPWAFTVVQMPPRQAKPEVHSAFDVHEILHAVAPHVYVPHDEVFTVRQAPDPSQVRAGVYVEPEQDSLTQIVPDQCPHAPAPSHVPLSPQLAGVSCGHSLSGSVPIETARQRPLA
jgi:hypothetical protein